jgi:hydrophobic/amphiphilic exporter-1 (mainly G- bacteria), HAE1 family
MKKMALLAALVVVSGATGADADTLSRADAVRRALDVNPEVRKSREDINKLRGFEKETLADALPEVNVFGTYVRFRDPSLLNSSSFDQFPPDLINSLTPVPTNIYEGQARLTQTLFNFKIGKAIRGARLARQRGDENLQRTRQQIALLAVTAYNQYVLSLEKVRVAEKAIRQKEEALAVVKNRRQAGVATDLDVLRAQVDLENARTQMLRIGGESDLARGNLNAALVRPIAAAVTPIDDLRFEDMDAELDAVVAEAWSNRPEAKAIDLSERIAEELIGIAQADFRPRLDLDAGYGWSVRRPEDFFESKFSKWNIGLTLKIPVFDGFRTAGKVAQARADKAQVTQDRVALENQVRLEAKDGLDRLRVAKSVLEAADLNVTQAQKALDMTQANYKYGAATLLDVLDAQAALTQAESNRVEALYVHANARASLRYVMGRDPLSPSEASPSAPEPPTTPQNESGTER